MSISDGTSLSEIANAATVIGPNATLIIDGRRIPLMRFEMQDNRREDGYLAIHNYSWTAVCGEDATYETLRRQFDIEYNGRILKDTTLMEVVPIPNLSSLVFARIAGRGGVLQDIPMTIPSYTRHPEYAAFMRSIRANPADDLPRLVYADWLDDHVGICEACGGRRIEPGSKLERIDNTAEINNRYDSLLASVPIGNIDAISRIEEMRLRAFQNQIPSFTSAPCPTCHGTGTNGASERAEFIRLALADAAIPLHECDSIYPGCTVSVTEVVAHDHKCRGHKLRERANELLGIHKTRWLPNLRDDSMRMRWHRGFIAHVRCTMAQFEQHAGEIARHHPVTRWEITDREPYRPNGDSVLMHRDDAVNGYWWLPPTVRALPSDIPRSILELMSDDWDGVSRSAKGFHTREAAIEALNAACCLVANERAEALENQRSQSYYPEYSFPNSP